MPPANKIKILQSALSLFNRDGLVNVRLQHISDASVVSLGNIAYHFKNKEAIVLAIWEELASEQRRLLHEYRVLPLFEDTERLLHQVYTLQQAYIFFYLDTLEIMRGYPEVAVAHRQLVQWQEQQMEMMLRFNEARGAFVKEPVAGFFSTLSRLFWMTADVWASRQAACGVSFSDWPRFRDTLWSLLQPLFSDRGWCEYYQLPVDILEK